MLALYSLFITLMLPFICLRLLWKSRGLPAYRHRIAERFGCFKAPHGTTDIWLHAVSLGESIAAEPLLKKILEYYPDKRVVVTNMTPTGSERVRRIFGDSVLNLYVPYDYPGAIRRFLNRLKPQILILMETELWPNLISECSKRKIPILIANARLSEASSKGYRRIRPLMAKVLPLIDVVAVQTEADGQRYRALGTPAENIHIMGNVKFDLTISNEVFVKGQEFREKLGVNRPVWVAASTHAVEEDVILAAHAKIQAVCNDALLLLVPRHPERFDSVEEHAKRVGFTTGKRTQGGPWFAETDVVIGNSIGEMMMYYASSDIAFVGGSLVPVGGHNVLEPAALSKPVISGPRMHNFAEVERLLKEKQGLSTVNTAEELAATVINLIQNPNLQEHQGQNALEVVTANRGSVMRHMKMIGELLEKTTESELDDPAESLTN